MTALVESGTPLFTEATLPELRTQLTTWVRRMLLLPELTIGRGIRTAAEYRLLGAVVKTAWALNIPLRMRWTQKQASAAFKPLTPADQALVPMWARQVRLGASLVEQTPSITPSSMLCLLYSRVSECHDVPSYTGIKVPRTFSVGTAVGRGRSFVDRAIQTIRVQRDEFFYSSFTGLYQDRFWDFAISAATFINEPVSGEGAYWEWLRALTLELIEDSGLFMRNPDTEELEISSAVALYPDQNLLKLAYDLAMHVFATSLSRGKPLGVHLSAVLLEALEPADSTLVKPTVQESELIKRMRVISDDSNALAETYRELVTPTHVAPVELPSGEVVEVVLRRTSDGQPQPVQDWRAYAQEQLSFRLFKSPVKLIRKVHPAFRIRACSLEELRRTVVGDTDVSAANIAGRVIWGGSDETERPVIETFKAALAEVSDDDRKRLLKFWTGFEFLTNRELNLLVRSHDDTGLFFVAHVCIPQIAIPFVTDVSHMADAIKNTGSLANGFDTL